MSAREIADKYIARDGKSPQTENGQQRLCLADIGDIITVARFLAWQEDNEWRGGVRGAEAWLAFCRIVGLPAGEFRQVVKD